MATTASRSRSRGAARASPGLYAARAVYGPNSHAPSFSSTGESHRARPWRPPCWPSKAKPCRSPGRRFTSDSPVWAKRSGSTWVGRMGAAVAVSSAGWAVLEDGSPVVFRRSTLTGELPLPVQGGDVTLLRDVVGVLDEDGWALVVGWMVGALIPDIPRPVLFMAAEAGSAKTTITKMVVSLIDPSPSPDCQGSTRRKGLRRLGIGLSRDCPRQR